MSILIRAAKLSDARAIADAQVVSWHETYTGIVPQSVIDGRTLEKRQELWERLLTPGTRKDFKTYVAEIEGCVVGFVDGGPARDLDLEFDGELCAIYLKKEFMGRGIGKLLVTELKRYLKSLAFQKMYLWVLADNPTVKIYEALGGIESGISKMESFGEIQLKELLYYWELD